MFDLAAESRDQAQTLAIDWKQLEGRNVLITGATGLIGSACARLLLERNRLGLGEQIGVTCLVRNAQKANDVIHAACPTASRFFTEHPVETADAIVLGTRRMLAIACDQKVAGFVYASSMEAYGNGNDAPGLDRLLDESQVGYVNPLVARSCYPEGKRMAEQYCCDFAAEYGVPAMVVRLAQTFGPGIPKTDTRLFAMCVKKAMAGEDIVLSTTGASTRMYLYTADAVSALFTVLLSGEPGTAYNAANPATYSAVRELAETAADLVPETGVEVRCEVDPSAPYPPEHHLPLDVSRLLALGWQPTQDLRGMLGNLMEYLKD